MTGLHEKEWKCSVRVVESGSRGSNPRPVNLWDEEEVRCGGSRDSGMGGNPWEEVKADLYVGCLARPRR